jgi:Carboxypeptidase regulatory-like domain
MVKKEGFAPAYWKQFRFEPVQKGSPQEVAPIRLERGVTLRGTVVDPQGRPVEGALVQPNVHSFASKLQFTRTDEKGRFTVRVSKGLIPIVFTYGDPYSGRE